MLHPQPKWNSSGSGKMVIFIIRFHILEFRKTRSSWTDPGHPVLLEIQFISWSHTTWATILCNPFFLLMSLTTKRPAVDIYSTCNLRRYYFSDQSAVIDQSPISQVRVKLTSAIRQTYSKSNWLIGLIGRIVPIDLDDGLNFNTSHDELIQITES